MRPQDSVVAGRYARALFQAARAAKVEEKVRRELRRFAQLLRTSRALSSALRHPLLPPSDKKRRVLKELGPASALFERFMGLALAKKRLDLVQAIEGKFEEMADEAGMVLKVHVKSAFPLGAEQAKALEGRLAKSTGRSVVLESAVDESLLGGLLFRVEDRVWDLSLRGQLQTMKKRLLESANI